RASTRSLRPDHSGRNAAAAEPSRCTSAPSPRASSSPTAGASRACLGSPAEPFVDRRGVDGGFVADGELVEAGGDRAVAFEPVDAALHGVPLLVGVGVERGGPPPPGAPLARGG